MHSSLWRVLVFIFILSGLAAIPALLQVRRSLPCQGEVMAVTESQREQRDSDGQLTTVFTSTYEIRFKNPRTAVAETQFIDNIDKKKGDSVRLRYDPSNSSIALDNPLYLYKTPLWIFGILFVLWILVVIGVVS